MSSVRLSVCLSVRMCLREFVNLVKKDEKREWKIDAIIESFLYWVEYGTNKNKQKRKKEK